MQPALPWRYVIAFVVAVVLAGMIACSLVGRIAERVSTQPPADQTTEQQSQQEQPEIGYWHRLIEPMALLTLTIAVSTGGLWVAGIRTARRQLRAYMVLKAADLVEKNETLTVTLSFMNSGQTPAYDYYVFSEPGVFDKDFMPTPIIPPDPAEADKSIVGPGQIRPYAKRITTKRLDLVMMKEGRKYGFIWGEAHYRDIFGKPRFLTFTCRTGRDVHGKWVLQPKGNQEAN